MSEGNDMKWTDAKIADEVTQCLSDARSEMGMATGAVLDDTINECRSTIRSDTIDECRKVVCGRCRDGTLCHSMACRAIVHHFFRPQRGER